MTKPDIRIGEVVEYTGICFPPCFVKVVSLTDYQGLGEWFAVAKVEGRECAVQLPVRKLAKVHPQTLRRSFKLITGGKHA